MYTQEMLDKQLALEIQAKEEAENHMKKLLEKDMQEKEAGEGVLAGKFIRHSWDDCRANITAVIAETIKPKKTTQGKWLIPMRDLVSLYGEARQDELIDLLVSVGLSTLISEVLYKSISDATQATMSYCANAIGISIQREANIEKFYLYEASKGTDLKWLTASMETAIKQRARKSYKIAYAVKRMHEEGFYGLKWSNENILTLGAKVLEAIIAGSDYFKIVQTQEQHITSYIVMSEWFEKAWKKNSSRMIANAVRYLPTIIPPRDWTSPFDGGYYGASMMGTQLVRTHYAWGKQFLNQYNERLNAIDLSAIYKAINALQATPFVINKRILKTLKEIYASGGELGGVPRTEPLPKLAKLPDTATEEELREHKKRAVVIYKQEEARKSKALRCLMALKTAEKFNEYDKIYFPWNVDYRGRCYPIPTVLSPQGDDIQKSLLLFANPSPLKEEDDRWMAIHGANLSGNDKIPFDERIAWVKENTTNIIASAEDPLGYRWWYEVSKGDYPMEFLAFCFEWADLQTYKQEHGTVKGFMSSLPLAFDGTCSGLQHFSALLRDEVGGMAVNLVPSDRVQDIYNIVADKVNVQLLKDAISGTEDGTKTLKDGTVVPKYGTKTLAQNWVMFNRIKFGKDGITRKVCKRSVMTLAYGSKQYGFKENLMEDIVHPYILDHPDDNPFINASQACAYMAKLIWDAVGATVVKAVESMNWLQKMSDIICQDKNTVLWFTPNNLPVQQHYMKTEQHVVKLRFNKARVRFYTQSESGTKVDKKAQKNGIAPNFIHSMDATHLQRVIIAEKELGNNNFMMIHDSFGTDCAHAGELYKTIRQEFIKLYKDQNHLQNFLEQVEYLIPEGAEIPEIPAFGKLNLDEVLNSDFCFA